MDQVAKLSERMLNNRFPKIKYELLKYDKSFHNNLKKVTTEDSARFKMDELDQ